MQGREVGELAKPPYFLRSMLGKRCSESGFVLAPGGCAAGNT